MDIRNIELFFLNTLLRVSMFGVGIVLCVDVLIYPTDLLSIIIDIAILSASVLAFVLRKKHPTIATFIITLTVLGSMLYQAIVVPANTTTSLSVILVVGFIFSVMLKGKTMYFMHGVTCSIIFFIFFFRLFYSGQEFSSAGSEVLTITITYAILYFILTYATAVLKGAYDKIYLNLSSLNATLEETVKERTWKIQRQNEALLKYSYANAHHLRGPVARLLGLAIISRMNSDLTSEDIISKMEMQAREIDAVVWQINKDLAINDILSTKSSQKQVDEAIVSK